MVIKSNVFYVTCEKTVYVCWEKVSNLNLQFSIYRNGIEIANSENDDFIRPYEFDNDHHTELFKPATRNWLYFKDHNVQDLQKYQYSIKGNGGTTSEIYESLITEVYTS